MFFLYGIFDTDTAFDFEYFGVLETYHLRSIEFAYPEHPLGSQTFFLWQYIHIILDPGLDVCLGFNEVVQDHISLQLMLLRLISLRFKPVILWLDKAFKVLG